LEEETTLEKRATVGYVTMTILIFAFIIGFAYFAMAGNPIQKSESKQEVLNYLVQDKHYTTNDILQIDEFYNMFTNSSQGDCHYGAKVVFRSNPNVEDYYVICSPNKIVLQNSISN
jgi:hypothetical protein